MDNRYVGADPMILRAITPSHSTPCPENLSSLVRLPSLGSTSPLPGLHDAASRVKCEDRAGIFSRAAAHLCERTAKCPESSFGSPPTCDLHSCQVVYYLSSSTVPMFATTDVVSSSCNTLNYRGSSIYKLPYLAHVPVANLTTQELYESEGDYHVLVSPARFSELMLHVMETSEASSSRLMSSSSSPPTTSSTPPTTSTVDKNSSLTEGITSSPMYSKLSTVQANVLGGTPLYAPDSPNSPSKQDSSVMSAEDSDADRKIQSNVITKRRNCGLRKTQPKKVVCIPSGESKQKGSEAPRSDTWAWRKYGQKPIKGSPFPRGYYRCSSSKGCPARKQVERSRSDPTMVMVTYTADHNHTWPASRSSNSSKAGPSRDKSQDMEDTRSYQKVENLFSSIINSPSAVDEQVISSMDSLQEEESFALQRDVDLCLSRTSCTEGDDVFDNLGELPELSAIFSKGYGEGQLDEGNCERLEFL